MADACDAHRFRPFLSPCKRATCRHTVWPTVCSERTIMRFDKYTIKAQEAVARAQELARTRDHSEILPLHVLAALLAEDEGVVRPLLQKIGVDAARVAQIVD